MSVTLSGVRQKAPVSEKALPNPVPPVAVIPNRYEQASGKIVYPFRRQFPHLPVYGKRMKKNRGQRIAKPL